MPSTGSHPHPSLRPGAESVAATLTRRHPRRQPLPTPSNRAPCRRQRRRGHRQPSPRASHNKTRAYAAHLLPPAPQPLPWSWGCGCSLYPPPPARPAAL
eukprot:scaffold148_cov144-Isochrysis_galbana.AAC.14